MSHDDHDAPATNYAVIPHVSKPQIALLFYDDLWHLPEWTAPANDEWQAAAPVNRAVEEQFGLAATTLRCLGERRTAEGGRLERVYELEQRSPAWQPPGRGRWVGRDALDVLPLARADHRALLLAWFAELERGAASRQPWARRGWFDATVNWIREQLRLRGVTLERAEQVRTWERSCVLRVSADVGPLYFKAVPQFFAYEPRVTAALGRWFPDNAPRLVALDDDRHWMLTHEAGGTALDAAPDLARWEAALRRYAEMQIGLALRRDELLSFGVPERRLDDLPGQVAALLADDAATGLAGADLDQLRARAADVPAQVAALAALGLPPSLEHGDFHPGTIIDTGAHFIFLGWSDGGVAHPFFGPALFLREHAGRLANADAARDRLRAAYLAPWTLYKPEANLRAAFESAGRLAPLHYAVIAQRDIPPRMAPHWEMAGRVPFALRLLLDEQP